MKRCPNCGYENSDDYTFCAECGARLKQGNGEKQSKSDEEEMSSSSELPDRISLEFPAPEPTVVRTYSGKTAAARSAVKVLGTLILAGVCFAGGLLGRRLLPAAQNTSSLEVHHDAVSLTTALCFDAQNYSSIGSLTVVGPQGNVLDTIEQVRDSSYRFSAPSQSLVYMDSQGFLYLKPIGEEAILLSQKADWSSIEVSEDENLLIYPDQAQGNDAVVVYDLNGKKEIAVLDTAVKDPFYDAETQTFYYINEDNTLVARDSSGTNQRIKGDVYSFEVKDGTIFCNKAADNNMIQKSYVIGEEEEITLDGRCYTAFADSSRNQYIVIMQDPQARNAQILLCVPGLDPVILDKNISGVEFGSPYAAYARASGMVYYVKNGSLYCCPIPVLDEKTRNDQELFEEALDVNKEKLASAIQEQGYQELGGYYHDTWKASPNGENLAWLNGKGELLFYCQPLDGTYMGGEDFPEPLRVDLEVRDFWVSDTSLTYLTNKWEVKKLPLTPGVLPENAKDTLTLYAMDTGEQEGEDLGFGRQGLWVRTSQYGDYTAVADPSTGLLRVFNSKNEGITLEPHMDSHTKTVIQNSVVWEKQLTLDDVTGFYYFEDEGGKTYLEITPDSQWNLFRDASSYLETLRHDLSTMDGIYRLYEEAGYDPSTIMDGISRLYEASGYDPRTMDGIYRLYEDRIIELNGDFTWEGQPRYLTLDSTIDWDAYFAQLNAAGIPSELSVSEYDPMKNTSIKVQEDGSFAWIISEGDIELPLTRITNGQYTHARKALEREIDDTGYWDRKYYIEQEERRIAEEKRKQEEEQKRQALETQAKSYYQNGVYLAKGTRLYSSPSIYSSTTRTTSQYETWSVYDYQTEPSSNRIWLKVKDSRNTYYWVYK